LSAETLASNSRIQVVVNGEGRELGRVQTVQEFLALEGIKEELVSIQLNGEFVRKERFAEVRLNDGDELKVLYFMGGGAQERAVAVSSVLDLVGATPLVKLNRIADPDGAEVWVKVEAFNPGGSVKDRIALAMIEAAEASGQLKAGGRIVEPTSGNTGIGLAIVAAVKGYPLTLVMPESMSMERRQLLKAFGAELVLTPAEGGMGAAIEEAKEIVARGSGAFMPQQFENPANPDVHRQTTAKEILKQTGGQVDVFVAGVGTGGTVTGVGQVLKEELGATQVVAVEPADSAVLSGGEAGPHKIQGIGAGFVPKVLATEIIDRVVTVKNEDAFIFSRRLALEEGLLSGISAGANVWAAVQIAAQLSPGQKVVTVLPDTGERYLSLAEHFDAATGGES